MKEKADRPAAARDFLKTVRRMLQYCISIGEIETDPTAGIKLPKARSRGIHSWSEDQIAQLRSYHAIGTTARLALELLLGTGQRRSDVVRMGRQHLRHGGAAIHVHQKKTNWEGDIPLSAELTRVPEATPTTNLTFLVTSFGAPFTEAGFGNKFRDWCNDAGLPRECSSHGLRKAARRRLAEAGCTAHEIAAISGHLSRSEVQRYTRAADQRRLAVASMAKARTNIA